jgi:peptidoglycan/xylan/chitin deacetylase (PgdA/CDA1 family)
MTSAPAAGRIVPVLLYHSISDHPGQDEHFAVSPAMFEAHTDAIAASGRATVTISELARAIRGEKTLPPRVAAITFDDGFADNHAAVVSLTRRGLRSTLYLTTGPLGTGDRLANAQAHELAHMPGAEVGAHSVHHPYLDELGDETIAEEVGGSRRRLEDVVGARVRSFAYPHGAYDARVRQAVINAGYDSAVAVKNALSHLQDDRFAIARWTVTADTTAERIAQVLEGADVPRAWRNERVRTRAYRSVRRMRRRMAGMGSDGARAR